MIRGQKASVVYCDEASFFDKSPEEIDEICSGPSYTVPDNLSPEEFLEWLQSDMEEDIKND